MLTNVALYCRYSSDNQREESIEAQIRAGEEYAKRNGWHVVKTYIDRAASATSDRRPEFQKMIAESGQNIFDMIIVHKLDRFARDRYDSAFYKRMLKQNGVRLVSVLENLDGSPESIMLESLLEGMAEYYSKNLAREVMKGMSENAYKCCHNGGIPPLGFDVDPETKKYVINEREAETVKLIFDMYLSGYGYDKIVTELNAKGFRTKLNRPFGKGSIHDLLRNEKYAGMYVFSRSSVPNCHGKRNNHADKSDDKVIRVEGGMPAIISQEVFDKAREKMKANKRQPGRYKAKEIYLLSGLIVCGECLKREGRSYSMMGNVKYSGSTKTKHVVYRCGNRERTKQCANKEIRRESIEEFVLSELERQIFSEKSIPKLLKRLNEYQLERNAKSNIEIPEMKDELARAKKEIGNIIAAVINGFSQSAMAGKLAELEERKADLEARIAAITGVKSQCEVTEADLQVLFGRFRQYIREQNVPEIKKFIGSYIDKVIVFKDHVEVVFFFCPDANESEPYSFRASVKRRTLIRYWGKVA